MRRLPSTATKLRAQRESENMNPKKDEKKPEPDSTNQGTAVAARTTGSSLVEGDFGDDAGKGLENVSAAERSIPFFRILQSNNPQVKDPREGGLPGARPGMILNLATNELFDGIAGIPFIPVHRDHNFPEWTPRAAGGGFVTIHADDDPLVLELQAAHGKFGKLPNGVTKRNDQGQAMDGTELTETYYLYGLATDDYVPALVAFTSTQIKKYKNFINRVTGFKYKQGEAAVVPPLFAHKWLLQTVSEKNKKGDFYGWRLSLFAKNADGSEAPYIQSLVPRSDPLYGQGKELYTSIAEGRAKVDFSKTENEEADDTPPM